MLKRIIKRALKMINYDIKPVEKKIGFKYNLDHSETAKEDVSRVRDYTMLSTLKLVNLYEKVAFCEKHNIDGAFVECGVWKGGAVGMMALANLRFSNKRRKLHLFDAFDDICEPDPDIDGLQAVKDVTALMGKEVDGLEGRLKPIKGVYDSRGGHGSIEGCTKLLSVDLNYDKNFLFFHKGWFQDTIPIVSQTIEKIAILRLDGDWYSSTKICLDFLYDKVVKGGFIIIDDYGRYEGCKKAVDDFFSSNGINVFLHYSNYNVGECRYFIKP